MAKRLKKAQVTCPGCEGSGCGPCATCGDGYQECACEDPDWNECDQCDGTGEVEDDGSLEETARNDEGD